VPSGIEASASTISLGKFLPTLRKVGGGKQKEINDVSASLIRPVRDDQIPGSIGTTPNRP
jgi:hypothetical protein